MQVSGPDSQAAFVHSHFFPEAVRDENAGRAQEAQKENHSREVDAQRTSALEDTANIEHAPQAAHAAPSAQEGQQDPAGDSNEKSEAYTQAAAAGGKQEEKARFFDVSGKVANSRNASVVDVFG